MSRVGTLTVMGLAVYRNRDGTLWFRDGGVRERLHGNMKWETPDGRRFRGSRPEDDAPGAAAYSGPSESEGEDDESEGEDNELQRALTASLHDEEAMLRAAIEASLADARGQDAAIAGTSPAAPPPAPLAEAPQAAPPQAEAPPQCSICMDDITRGQDARALPCSHSFHRACVDRWLRQHRACPVCRERV